MPPVTFEVTNELIFATLPKSFKDPHPADSRQAYGITDPDDENDDEAAALESKGPNAPGLTKLYAHIAKTLSQADVGEIKIETMEMHRAAMESEEENTGYGPHFWVLHQSSLAAVERVYKLLSKTYRIVTHHTSGSWPSLDVYVGFVAGDKQINLAAIRKDGEIMNAINKDREVVSDNLTAIMSTFEARFKTYCMFDGWELDLVTWKIRTRLQLKSWNEFLTPELDQHEAHSMAESRRYWIGVSVSNALGFVDCDTVDDDDDLKGNGTVNQVARFSQHKATLDVERVKHWINLCVGLVRFAVESTPDDVKKCLAKYIPNEECTPEELFRHIGLDDEAEFYAKNGYNTARRDGKIPGDQSRLRREALKGAFKGFQNIEKGDTESPFEKIQG